jgi:sec-independent protein translocase protein TatC
MTSEPLSGEILPAAPQPSGESVMPLVDHLSELRWRLIWSAVAVAVGSAVGFVLSDVAIKVLEGTLPAGTSLIVTNVGDAFGIKLKLAIVIGVILAMPALLWNFWRFVAPGLTASERRVVLPWIPATLAFFALGVGVAYVVLPFANQFLISFTSGMNVIPLLSAREYLDFVSMLFLAFGILMEFPVVLVGLSRVGVVTSQRLRRSRRFVILGIAVFSAVATPGTDVVSPTVLGVTLYVLFELTIIVIRRSGR